MKSLTLKSTVIAGLIMAGPTFIAATANAHTITAAKGEVDTNSSYIGNDGKVIKTGMGECLRSSAWSADGSAANCEGGAPEKVADPEPEAKAPEPKPEPKQVATVETTTIDGVGLFASDSDKLTAEGAARVDALLAELSTFKGILGIDITGHTDSRGAEDYNMALSQRRADAVMAVMAARYPGVDITATGMGESAPVASNASVEGRQANRRVEIAVNASRMVFN